MNAEATPKAPPRKRRRRRRLRGDRRLAPWLRFSHWVEYAALRLGLPLVRWLPFHSLHGVAGALVFASWPFSGFARRRIDANLRLAFPEMDAAERRRLVRRNLRHTLRVMLEIPQLPRFRDPGFADRYQEFEDPELVADMQGREGGFVGIMGHFGNWELPIPVFARHGIHVHFALKHLENPRVDAHLLRMRQRYGGTAVPMENAGALVAALRAGEIVGLVADQNARSRGIFVEFFGVKASTYPGPALLALRMGVPIYLYTDSFVGRGVYRMRRTLVAEAPRRGDFGSAREAVESLTRSWVGALEKAIREQPEQYLWSHRRWKRRPPEEQAGTTAPRKRPRSARR